MRFMTMIKRISVLMLAASLLAGCKASDAGRPALLEPVNASLESGIVERRDLSDITVYTAQLLPGIEEIGFEDDGYLYGVYVEAGDRVGEGTVLAALVGHDFDAINSLEESIENSRTDFEKKFEALELEIELERLAGRNTDELKLQLKHEREKAELTIGEKEARLERLKETDIGYNYITAPCDCIVMAVTRTGQGGYVAAGTPVVAIDYGDEMTLTCDYISEVTVNHAYDCYAMIGGVRTELEYIPYTKDEMRVMSASSGLRAIHPAWRRAIPRSLYLSATCRAMCSLCPQAPFTPILRANTFMRSLTMRASSAQLSRVSAIRLMSRSSKE